MAAHELLEGLALEADDVEDIASEVADHVQAQRPDFSLELRWAIEGAVKRAFGADDEEADGA